MKKSDIKKRVILIFSVAALAFSFAGCDKNESQQSSVSESSISTRQEESVKNSDTEKELSISSLGEEHEFENIKSVQYSGENIYVYEQMSEAVQKELSVSINSASAESHDVDLSNIDYMYIQFAACNEKNTCIAYCDNENKQKICIIDTETGDIKASADISEDEYLYSLRNDENGNFTVVKTVYVDYGMRYHYETFNGETLESVSDFDLSEYLVSENENVSDALTAPDGTVYFFTVDYKPDYTTEQYLYKLDGNGELVYSRTEFEDWKGQFAGFYLHDNGNLCVCATDDKTEYYIYEIDNESGETREHHTVSFKGEAGFINTLRVSGYDFTYLGSSGVTGCSFDGSVSDVVLEFGKDLDPDLRSSFTASSYGDNVYMYLIKNVETGRTVTSMTRDGNIEFISELPAKLGYVSMFGTAPDGTIVYSETYDSGQNPDTGSEHSMTYMFHVLDEKGSPKSTFTVDEINSIGNATIQSIDISESGEIYMLFQTITDGVLGTRVYVTDRSGKILEKHILDMPDTYITDVVLTESSNYAVCINQEHQICYAKIEPGDTDIKSCEKLDIDDGAAVVKGGGSYDIYLWDYEKIYGYSLTDNKATEIMDISEFLEQTTVTDLHIISDSCIVCATYDNETGETGVTVLEK